MIRRTSGRLVAIINLREVSGSSRGTTPAAFSSGRVSSKIRPLDRATVIELDTGVPDAKIESYRNGRQRREGNLVLFMRFLHSVAQAKPGTKFKHGGLRPALPAVPCVLGGKAQFNESA